MIPETSLRHWLAGALLAVLAAAAFWPVVSGKRTFFHFDLRYEHLPVWHATQKALAAGESPFWIDGEYCGHPLLFTQEAPVFYPLTAPLLLTGAPVARLADLFSLFHFWLAGFAAFLLLEDLKTDPLSALFGGIAWMLSARLLQSAIWPNAVAVTAFLPLLLLGILRIASGRRISGVIVTAGAGALSILASRPQALLGAAPLICAVTAYSLVKAPHRARAAADLGLAALFALALGAPSLVPSAALYPEMSRAAGLSQAERDLGPIRVGSLDLVFLPVDGVPSWPEGAAYPGVITGVLFVFGIALALRGNRAFSRDLFLALLAGGAVGLCFSFGEAGPYRFFANLPLIRGFRVPARYLISWSLALAIGSALVLSCFLSRVSRPVLAGGAAVLLLAGDLCWHALRAAPTSPAALNSVEPDIVQTLRARLGRDEAGFPRRFWMLALRVVHIEDETGAPAFRAASADPLGGALGMQFGFESVGGAGPPLLATDVLLSKPTPRFAMLAGAGFVVVSLPRLPGQRLPIGWELRAVPSPLPRAILVSQAIPVSGDRALVGVLAPSFDPRKVVLVEGAKALELVRPEEDAGSVRLLSRRPGRVELETRAPSDRVLVLFDAWEKGWRARVDGEQAEVFRADAAFRGVRLAAGRHRVLFEYDAPGVKQGGGLFVAGILGLALFAIRARRDSDE